MLGCLSCLCAALTSCSVGQMFKDNFAHHEVMVVMQDSVRHAGVARIPHTHANSLKVKTEEEGTILLNSTEVAFLALRHNGGSGVMIYAPYANRQGRMERPMWMQCVARGPHLKICLAALRWRMTRDGFLQPLSFADGDVWVIALPEGDTPKFVTTMGRSKVVTMKGLVKALASDEVLCNQLQEGEIEADDFQTICRRFRPSRKRGSLFEAYHPVSPLAEEKGLCL